MSALVMLAMAAVGAGGPGRVWVYMADKGFASAAAEAAAVAALPSTYGELAVRRRALRRTEAGLFDARDLPVEERYVAMVEGAGGRVWQRSRWLNAVSVVATAEEIEAIRGLPCVTRVEPVRGGVWTMPREETVAVGGAGPRDFYGYSGDQLRQIGVPDLHAYGASGYDVVVGVLDTGFVLTNTAFTWPGHEIRVEASYDFVNNDANVGIEPGDHPDQHRHGTWITGTIGAYWPDILVGGAPDAKFVLCKTEDVAREVPAEEDNYVAGLEFAEQHGADVCTSSLGYIDWYTQGQLDGVTTVTAIAVNVATANGVVCVTAAGNEGHDGNPATSHLLTPADALRVISCGAVDASGAIAGFSSDGPSADGRVKPEILARGVDTWTVSSSDNGSLARVSGTSLSTPLVASAVACMVGAHPCWTVDEIRSRIFATGSRVGTADPLYVEGYGILNVSAATPIASCLGDFNDDGFLDFFDYDAFVRCFEGEVCPPCRSPDYNGDGFVDFFDVDAFVHDFELGC